MNLKINFLFAYKLYNVQYINFETSSNNNNNNPKNDSSGFEWRSVISTIFSNIPYKIQSIYITDPTILIYRKFLKSRP